MLQLEQEYEYLPAPYDQEQGGSPQGLQHSPQHGFVAPGFQQPQYTVFGQGGQFSVPTNSGHGLLPRQNQLPQFGQPARGSIQVDGFRGQDPSLGAFGATQVPQHGSMSPEFPSYGNDTGYMNVARSFAQPQQYGFAADHAVPNMQTATTIGANERLGAPMAIRASFSQQSGGAGPSQPGPYYRQAVDGVQMRGREKRRAPDDEEEAESGTQDSLIDAQNKAKYALPLKFLSSEILTRLLGLARVRVART